MINILLVIIATGGVFLTFRAFEKWGVDRFTAIVINYGVASGLGWTLAGGVPMMKASYEMPWFFVTAIMGAGFLYLFNLMAKCTAELGVAVSSIASKLSLVIPVAIFLIIDPNDTLSPLKAIALLLAVIAIMLSSRGDDSKHPSNSNWSFLLPIIIFIGSGAIDLIFAWYSSPLFVPNPQYAMAFTAVPFSVAFILGIIIWTYRNGVRKAPASKDLLAGILLGVVNFGSLFFLLGAYGIQDIDKSVMIPGVNIGVILFSTIGAVVIYKDSPSKITWAGLAIGLVSIIILMIA